jgi:hypothetical protein
MPASQFNSSRHPTPLRARGCAAGIEIGVAMKPCDGIAHSLAGLMLGLLKTECVDADFIFG